MRRLLLPLVLVVVVAACDTAPTPIQAPFWQGTVKFSVDEGSDDTWVTEGPVTWIKEEDPELAPLNGGASYIIQSGSLTATRRGGGSGCSVKMDTTLTLKPGDGSLTVYPSGSYVGRILATTPSLATYSCPGIPTVTGYDQIFIDLEMKGQVDYDLRMKGTMVPRGGGVTFTGSWDFFAKKTLAFAASNLG